MVVDSWLSTVITVAEVVLSQCSQGNKDKKIMLTTVLF